MSDEYEQIHLLGKRLCRRGVRYRELDSSEVRAVEEESAIACGREFTQIKFTNEKWRRGAARMVVSVTDPVDSLDGATWKPVTLQDLETPSSPLHFDKLFPRSQDLTVLGRAYSDLHELTGADVEAILGKASKVMRD